VAMPPGKIARCQAPHHLPSADHWQERSNICDLTTSATIVTFPIAHGEMNRLRVSNPAAERQRIMGDKSPKAVHKQAAQKQIKANAANQRKQQAVAAKQPAIKLK